MLSVVTGIYYKMPNIPQLFYTYCRVYDVAANSPTPPDVRRDPETAEFSIFAGGPIVGAIRPSQGKRLTWNVFSTGGEADISYFRFGNDNPPLDLDPWAFYALPVLGQ